MRRFNYSPLAIAAAAMAVTGCAGRSDTPPVRGSLPSRPAPRPSPPAVLMSPASYVATAAAIDLFEMRSAELALQRSASARTREFASMMIPAHRGMASQLNLAGRRLNLLPSATLPPRFQALLSELQTAADFDATYKRQQMALHQQALALHSSYAARGNSPTLRPVAAAAVPVIERHLRLLRYL